MPSTSSDRCDIEGFYGASSMERLPTEIAITNQIKAFKQITMKGVRT